MTAGSSSAQHAAGNETVIEGQKKALERAVHGAPLADVLEVLARTVESQSSSDVLASILLVDADGQRLRHGAAPSLPEAYNAAIDGVAIGPAVGSCGTAAYTKSTVVVSDITTDFRWAAFTALATAHGLRACWSMPILSPAKEVLGTFALYHRTATVPTARDQEIVELLGRTAALLIERDRFVRQQLLRATALFEHAPASLAVLRGPEHRFELANPRYTALVGGRALVGRTVREAFPELAGQGFYELLDQVYTSGTAFFGPASRVLLAHPDGRSEEIFVDLTYQPVPGPDGKIDSILVIAFEVTELARAKARAETSEQALKTFIDNLPDLAWTARPDGSIDYYNQRWYEYTGTTFEDMQGWGWTRVHDPELLPDVTRRWKHSLATGEPFEMEFTLRGADGVARWFLTRVAASRDAAGNIVRWFGTNVNIDAIKAAHALSGAMLEQSKDVQRVLLQMRADKERVERRLAELEARGS